MHLLLTTAAIGSSLDISFFDFDMSIFRFFGSIQNDILTVIAKIFTAMGETKYGIMIGIFGLILFLFKRTRKYGMAILFAIIIGTFLTNILIKPIVLRIRPYNTLQSIAEYFGWYTNAGLLAESDFSFPSGHTTIATELGVVLCLLFASEGKKRIAWIFPVVSFLVGCSRVYLMVHYATDVLAGFIVGIIAGILGYLISKWITARWSGSFSWHRFDLERIWRKITHRAIPTAAAVCCCVILWLIIFGISFVSVLHAGGEAERCAYDGDYTCYNESKDEYCIDGEYYCKIHYKELTDEDNAD